MRRLFALVLILVLAGPAAATPRDQLTISGRIAGGAPMVFDQDRLAELGTVTITSYTQWTTGPQVFEGVPLKRLLQAVDASGTELVMTAYNDYRVTIPAADAATYGVLIAFRQNGARLTLRDKGPFWIVYPVDTEAATEHQTFREKMIWQLAAIEVR